MPIDPQTRQQLLELAYDLLPTAEAGVLRRRIEDDPELAKAYAQVRREVRLLSEAAKIEAARVALRRPSAPRAQPVAAKRRRSLRDRLKVRWPLMRSANWVVGLLGAFFSLVALGGYWYHHEQLSGIAAEQLRLLVIGPACLQSGVPAVYTVQTSSVTGEAIPARIEFAVLLPTGQRLWRDKDECDKQGRLRVTLPADLKIPPDARLDVLAVFQSNFARFEAPLHVVPRRFAAALAVDVQTAKPGQSLRWRLDAVAQSDLADDREFSARVELRDPSGATVASQEITTVRGVGTGESKAPPSAAEGRYVLVARSLDGAFPDVQRAITVRLAAAAQQEDDDEDATQETPSQGAVRVAFFPEGGALAPDVENRVYFLARNESGKPIAMKGAVCDSRGNEVAALTTDEQGMGVLRWIPIGDESYRLRIAEPVQENAGEALPKTGGPAALALSAATSLIEANEPLRLAIRTRRPGVPLVATVCCRGVLLAQEPLVTGVKDGGLHALTIPLGAEAAGVLRVTVFDCTTPSPRPVAERLVYRRPSRQLTVRADGIEQKYAPGAKASLKLSVVNEQGRRVDAILGATVISAEGADALAAFRAHGAPESLFCPLRELATPASAESLDLTLGIWGWRRFVSQKPADARPAAACDDVEPPMVFDNIRQLRENYRRNLAAYQAHRTRLLMCLTTLSFLGGLGLVLLVSMLVLLRVATGVQLWVMAITAAACCVAAGMVLVDPNRLRSGEDLAVSFAPAEAVPADSQSGGDAAGPIFRQHAAQLLGEPRDAPVLAPPLLWLPLLPAKNGAAELSLQLPDTAGHVLLLLDARGEARLGGGRFPMVVEKP